MIRRTLNSIADDGHQLFARAESVQVQAHLFNNDAVVAKRSQEVLTTVVKKLGVGPCGGGLSSATVFFSSWKNDALSGVRGAELEGGMSTWLELVDALSETQAPSSPSSAPSPH